MKVANRSKFWPWIVSQIIGKPTYVNTVPRLLTSTIFRTIGYSISGAAAVNVGVAASRPADLTSIMYPLRIAKYVISLPTLSDVYEAFNLSAPCFNARLDRYLDMCHGYTRLSTKKSSIQVLRPNTRTRKTFSEVSSFSLTHSDPQAITAAP